MPQYRKVEKKKSKGLWPLYGLLMAVAAGAIAYVLAPQLLAFVLRRSPSFSIGTLSRDQVELLFGGIIFFVIIAVGGMIIAAFMPKKKMDEVQDKHLRKQKEQMIKDEKARRIRRAMVEREMKKHNKRLE